MRTLVIGGSGNLGYQLAKSFLNRRDEVSYTYLSNKCLMPGARAYELDVTHRQEVLDLITSLSPNIVVNGSSPPSMDLCEVDKTLAHQIGVEGMRNIVDACKTIGSKIVFVSTSAVFSGGKSIFTEIEDPRPLNYYGHIKVEGEKITAGSGLPFLILRTDQPYGWAEPWQKKNTVTRALEKFDAGEVLREPTDWYNNPTYIPDFVSATLRLLEHKKVGIYHLVGPGFLNRYEWSQKIGQILGKDPALVAPVNSAEFKLSAKRPNFNLSNQKIEAELNMKFASVEEGFRLMLQERGRGA